MLHGIKLRKIIYILTHHKIKSMTLMLKLFLFHILYACGNKITPFSSVCVNSQNLKICNLNCTVLLTLGVQRAWLPRLSIAPPISFCVARMKRKRKISDSQSPYTDRKIQKATWQHKNATKNFDFTMIAGRLGTVNWGNDSHPTDVVKPVYGIPTFLLTAKAV